MYLMANAHSSSLGAETNALVHRDRLPIGVLHQPVERVFASDTRFLMPTECLVGRILVNFIDPDRAGLQLRTDSLNSYQVFTPYGSPEAVTLLVGPVDNVLFLTPLEKWDDRAQRCLGNDARLIRRVIHSCDRDQAALQVLLYLPSHPQ